MHGINRISDDHIPTKVYLDIDKNQIKINRRKKSFPKIVICLNKAA